jgi:glucokinase
MDIFRDKAPLVDYLRALPVYVIINSSAELRAGAVHATAMCARP